MEQRVGLDGEVVERKVRRRERERLREILRPSARSISGSKLWMPSERRFTPAAKKSANFWRSNVPGFASRVTSAPGVIGSRARMLARSRSMAPAEKRLGVPPPRKMLTTLRPHTDGSALSRSAITAST